MTTDRAGPRGAEARRADFAAATATMLIVRTDGSLLAEIERDSLDGKPLADLLRECMLLGGRSGSQELRDWASMELRGYAGDANLPSYRVVAAPILLDAVIGNSWVTGQNVPETSLPDFVREEGLGNKVDLRQGVGELQAWAEASGKKDVTVSFPGAEVIGQYFDKKSGNPFQHIHRIYWSISLPAIHGVLDNIRTTLTELITELVAAVPRGQDVPTAEQADNAFNVAVLGKKSRVTLITSQASGGSTSSVQQGQASSGDQGTEPGWWTFGRKVWATVVSLFLVAGAVAAIIVIYH